MRRLFLLFCACTLLTSCVEQKESLKTQAIVVAPAPVITPEPEEIKEPYTVYIEKANYGLSLYEPENGCYLGAYILSNRAIDFDIQNFEDLVQKEHAIYMYNIALGENLPTTWLLSCISRMKTPCIVIQPDEAGLTYNEEKLISMAKAIGEFYVPMFVQFMPVEEQYNPRAYIDYYRKARAIFKKYASNAAFIWSVDISGVYDSARYYPGDDYVDWVGLSCYRVLNSEQDYGEDIFKGIDYFYNYFQKEKPIMITNLAISHLSNSNYIYHTTKAASEIDRVYSKIRKEYPRIKGIIYMDFNGTEVASSKDIRDNFSITDEEVILTAYQKSISQTEFLSECEVVLSGDASIQLFKSPFLAYKIKNDLFISDKSVLYDLGIYGVSGFVDAKIIDNNKFYSLKELEKSASLKSKEDISNAAVIIGK